jgi:hypothetical protein
MDEEIAGLARSGVDWPAPIEEVDPIAWLDDDHEAIRLCGGIRRRHGFHRP